MATGKAGILGTLNGSLGNVTMYRLKGTNVIRQKAVNVSNPQTPAQEAHRANVSFAIKIFKQLKPVLEFTLQNRPRKQSMLSEFLRLNLNKSIINSSVNFEELRLYSTASGTNAISINQASYDAGIIDGITIIK